MRFSLNDWFKKSIESENRIKKIARFVAYARYSY